MSRQSCIYCVLKHIGQASVLLDESKLGYPFHKWYAIGHLAEAESESLDERPELSEVIRNFRTEIMRTDKEPDYKEPSIDDLMMQACVYYNLEEELKLDTEHNSKILDIKNKKE